MTLSTDTVSFLVATDGSEVSFELTVNDRTGIRRVLVGHYSETDGMVYRKLSIGAARTIWTDLVSHGSTVA